MSSARILIVEDDAISGRNFQTALIQRGFSVPRVVSSGEDALKAVAELLPDLVVLDVQLSGKLDGIETARQIQTQSEVPVLYLSASTDDLSMNRAKTTFPFGYLIKPVTEDELVEAAELALNASRSGAGSRQQTDMVLATLRGMEQGVIAADLAGNVAYINRAAEELTGWTSEEALGKPLQTVFSAQVTEIEGAGLRQASLTRRDGSAIRVEDNSAPIENDDGSLRGMVTVFRQAPDANAPREAANVVPLVSESDSRLVSIARSIGDPLITFDADWKVTWLNPPAGEHYRIPRDQVIGREFWVDFPQTMRERYEPEFRKPLETGQAHNFEFHHEPADVWFHIHAYPFAEGVLVILRDITESRQASTESQRVERLDALGHLARGFAHDFNNLLTVLQGNLSVAREIAPDDASLELELDQSRDVALRAQDLVQQLLIFAEGGSPIRESVQVDQLIQSVIESRKTTSPDFHYQLLNECNGLTIQADPRQLRRLLTNLFQNAEQALVDHGGIFVHLRRDTDENSDHAVIEVTDSGTGMDEMTLQRAFDPFFTTREEDNATGLGLTVCESIARAHGGFLRLQSRAGQGTVVSAHFPAQTAEEEPLLLQQTGPVKLPVDVISVDDPEPETSESSSNGTVRVLVLEDEAMIRRLVTLTLTRAGYEVHETAEGSETIDQYRKSMNDGHAYDCLVMDLTIEGGMGGVETIGKIREMDPNALAIVSSGYSDSPAMANPAAYGFSAVLPKPYQPQQLVDVVKELVGAPKTD